METIGYWYCPNCLEELSSSRVTHQELCDTCGHPAIWVEDIDPNRLEEICNAEREGRVAVLPCKVGDTVYDRHGDPWEITQIEQHMCGKLWFRCGHKGTKDYTAFSGEDIEDCVFLTKPKTKDASEAAEQTLKEHELNG